MTERLHADNILRAAAHSLGITQIFDIGGDGWDYDTVVGFDEFGRRWIMRAARRLDVIPLLQRENAILPLLDLPLLIPRPEKFGLLENGMPCAAYQFIDASKSTPGNISANAPRLARALHALHFTPRELWEPHIDTSQPWNELVLEQLAATSEVVEWPTAVRTAWEKVLLLAELWSTPHVLCHGDLGPPHLLSRDNILVGIIDFGDLQCAPAAIDFGNILVGFGKEAMLKVLLPYAEKTNTPFETVMAGAYAYQQLGPMFTAFHGIKTDQPEFIGEALMAIQ